jgi:hypothetical protein
VSTEELKENEISLLFVGTDDYIGSVLDAAYTTNTKISDSLQLSIAGL